MLTAFDAWLNELIGIARMRAIISMDQVASLINKPLSAKYREAAQQLGGRRLKVPKDLALLSSVRDEIVHFLPYMQDVSSGKTIPPWLTELENRQLLINTGVPHAQFHFSQKLCSYALAYWACETAFNAACDLTHSLDRRISPFVRLGNFSFYQDFVAPADLEKFDKQFGLTLNA